MENDKEKEEEQNWLEMVGVAVVLMIGLFAGSFCMFAGASLASKLFGL